MLTSLLLNELAFHGVSLAASSLPIGKDAHLVAVQSRLHQLGDLIKHLPLRRGRLEDLVKRKGEGLCDSFGPRGRLRGLNQGDFLVVTLIKGDVGEHVRVGLLLANRWPDTTEHANVSLQLLLTRQARGGNE